MLGIIPNTFLRIFKFLGFLVPDAFKGWASIPPCQDFMSLELIMLRCMIFPTIKFLNLLNLRFEELLRGVQELEAIRGSVGR